MIKVYLCVVRFCDVILDRTWVELSHYDRLWGGQVLTIQIQARRPLQVSDQLILYEHCTRATNVPRVGATLPKSL